MTPGDLGDKLIAGSSTAVGGAEVVSDCVVQLGAPNMVLDHVQMGAELLVV